MKQAPVQLSKYNPEWPSQFNIEKEFLINILSRWFNGSVEHIGSTAVPGLISKLVIDIMFGIHSLRESRPAIDVLVDNGYKYFPYNENAMHWFCKPSDEFRTHHLHLIPYGNPLWQERIKFRELLCSNSLIANEYSELKIELATRFRNDREAYTEGKSPFVRRVLEQENNR